MFGLFKKPVATVPYDARVQRTERLRIQLTLDKVRAAKHAAILDSLLIVNRPHFGDDMLTLHYTLDIDYLGNIVEKLTAIESLLNDPGVVRHVETDELLHGRSVIQTILLKLNSIERKK